MPLTNQCPNCKHYLGRLNCAAFPEGIPIEILTGEYDHTKSHEGDDGIIFEPDDEQGS